jgi:hypothetical protein
MLQNVNKVIKIYYYCCYCILGTSYLYADSTCIKCVNCVFKVSYHPRVADIQKKKVKQSLYTPWRRLGGEEV